MPGLIYYRLRIGGVFLLLFNIGFPLYLYHELMDIVFFFEFLFLCYDIDAKWYCFRARHILYLSKASLAGLCL